MSMKLTSIIMARAACALMFALCASLILAPRAVALQGDNGLLPGMQESTALNLAPMAPHPTVAADGSITTPSFRLPFSAYASPQAREAFIASSRMAGALPPNSGPLDMLALRRLVAPLSEANARKAAQAYPYSSERIQMGGVPVEVFTPASGIARENRNRVLINLHGGGGFLGGGGTGGVIEAAPIAHYGRIKVVAIDYRMGPEFTFPAALQDVAAVYRELLRTYRPENIGIYGCSSGGFLTAQTVAWFRQEDLPQAGALGVLCSSLMPDNLGDSAYISAFFGGGVTPVAEPPPIMDGPSMRGVARDNPLAVPSVSEDVLRAFPPTLFLTGTRAPEMSAATQSQVRLLGLGVDARLVLFDGLGHGFYSNPDLPESEQAGRIIAQFFAENLGHRNRR